MQVARNCFRERHIIMGCNGWYAWFLNACIQALIHTMFHAVLRFIGIQSHVVASERLAATLGGMIAIFFCFSVTAFFTDAVGTAAILPSMGASTVLLFAVPHGQLSTPWALFAGNLLSAAVGVSCAYFVGNIYLAASLAVAASILVMHLTRSLHPPGGATALAAVIGGAAIDDLGYWYILVPTLVNCLIIFAVALLFNNLFAWRRYPQNLMQYHEVGYHPDTRQIKMRHIHEAIARSELVIDASDQQIKHIIDLADAILHEELIAGSRLEPGAYYTNNKPGRLWSVRQVIDHQINDNPDEHLLTYRVIEGEDKGTCHSCTFAEFAEWASSKIQPKKRR